MTNTMTDHASGQHVDGDLLREAILDACPYWIAQEAADELAETALANLARDGYYTITRGPGNTVWSPDHTPTT